MENKARHPNTERLLSCCEARRGEGHESEHLQDRHDMHLGQFELQDGGLHPVQ